MSKASNLKMQWKGYLKAWEQLGRWQRLSSLMIVTLMPITVATGCHTPQPPATVEKGSTAETEEIVLAEGDVVRVSFPGASNLNSPAQHIRRDGVVSLPVIGDFKAAGLRPTEMEKELVKLYGSQLQTKEVKVEVDSATLSVYVTGAVLRPGKINSERSISALEAIMEAGGFDYTKANLKAVRIIRQSNGRTEYHTINLKRVLEGQPDEPFPLKPSDIIYVPERFSWF